MTLLLSGPAHLEMWQARLRDPCFVYIVRHQGSGLIKIGKAKDVRRRVSELQVGNPVTLELLYVIPTASARTAIQLEANLHKRADQAAVRGEWFSGEAASLVLLVVDGLARKMVDVYDGGDLPPNVWAVLPPPACDPIDEIEWHEEMPQRWHAKDEERLTALYDQLRERADTASTEAGIAPLSESHWPRIAHLFMDGQPLEAIALEMDVTDGRLKRTMEAMRRGGYALDPGTRRVRDPYGHESSRRWIRASS